MVSVLVLDFKDRYKTHKDETIFSDYNEVADFFLCMAVFCCTPILNLAWFFYNIGESLFFLTGMTFRQYIAFKIEPLFCKIREMIGRTN